MPFKDQEKKKAYYERHKKFYDAEYKKKNREKWNDYQREQKRKNQSIYYERLKNNPVQLEKAKESSRKYLKNHKNELNKRFRQETSIISDKYIKRQLSKEGISPNIADENYDLIEIKRLLIKTKRELNNKQ